jgi:hypothetical protein
MEPKGSLPCSLGTRWRWVASFMPRPLYPRQRATDTCLIWGWVGTRAGLVVMEKRKILPLLGFEPRPSIPQPVFIPTELSLIPLSIFSLLSYFEKNRVGLWDYVCSPCVYVCVFVSVYPLSLLGNGSVKVPLLFLVNRYVFYAVCFVSNESRRFVLPRASCYIILPFTSRIS